MNVLNKIKIYTVGNMENADGRGWRNKFKDSLRETGIITYDPYCKPFESDFDEDIETHNRLKRQRANGDLEAVKKHMKSVVRADLSMVDRADCIVCFLQPDIPTYGTIHEIVMANQLRKPIFIAVEGGVKNTPLWLLGLLPLDSFFNSIEDIVQELKKLDSGQKPMDYSRWRIFKEEFR